MFSSKDNSRVDYYEGVAITSNKNQDSVTQEQIQNRRKLQSTYYSVAYNCTNACSSSDEIPIPSYDKESYLSSAKVGQRRLKSRTDYVQSLLDSCIRRCFVDTIETTLGEEKANYAKLSAMEYDQSDINHFKNFNYQNIAPRHVDSSVIDLL